MSHRKRVTNNLTALGSAAVVAVYGAGYMRTAEAAQRYAAQSDERRVPPPDGGTYEPPNAAGTTAAAGRAAGAALPSPNATQRLATAEPPRVRPSDAATAAGTGRTAVPTPVGTATPAKRVADPGVASAPPPPVPVIASAPTPVPVPVQGAQSVASAAVQAPAVTAPVPATITAVAPPAAVPVTVPPAPKPVVASPPAPVPVETAPAKTAVAAGERAGKWKDGNYTGWGTSRHGDIQAYLEIDGGKITFVRVEQCLTQYSCSWIEALPMQVLTRQSPDVDAVSGATQSANAFYYAIVQALSKAK